MSHVSIRSAGRDYAHHISTAHHTLVADEPASLGGQDQGMAPFDLYLASLAACTAITLRMYAQKKGRDLGQFSAELTSKRDADGRLHVHRKLYASASLSDVQWDRLLDVATRTPVTLVMRKGATITSERA